MHNYNFSLIWAEEQEILHAQQILQPYYFQQLCSNFFFPKINTCVNILYNNETFGVWGTDFH